MRAIHMIAGVMFVTLMLCGAASALHTGEGNTPRTADEALGLIVKFKSDVDLTPADGSRSRRTTGLAAFDKANAMHNVQNVCYSYTSCTLYIPYQHMVSCIQYIYCSVVFSF